MVDPKQGANRRKRCIDCYEFYLWSIGKKIPRGYEDTDFWHYVRRMEVGEGFYGVDDE